MNGEEETSWVEESAPSSVLRDQTTDRKSGALNTLDEIVLKLREIERQTGIERTIAIGELVLERFYSGSTSIYRDRSAHKVNSLRRLAQRPDCPVSRSTLNDAVGVYLLVLEMPHLREYSHVASSHIREVLRLPPALREALLQEAESKKWSVRDIRERAHMLRREQGERRGRPISSDDDRLIAGVRSSLRVVGRAIEDLEVAPTLNASTRAQVLELGSELSDLGVTLADIAHGTKRLAVD